MSEFNKVDTLLATETYVNSIINDEIENVIRGYGRTREELLDKLEYKIKEELSHYDND